MTGRAELVAHVTAPMTETSHPFQVSEFLASVASWRDLVAWHRNAHGVRPPEEVDHP